MISVNDIIPYEKWREDGGPDGVVFSIQFTPLRITMDNYVFHPVEANETLRQHMTIWVNDRNVYLYVHQDWKLVRGIEFPLHDPHQWIADGTISIESRIIHDGGEVYMQMTPSIFMVKVGE